MSARSKGSSRQARRDRAAGRRAAAPTPTAARAEVERGRIAPGWQGLLLPLVLIVAGLVAYHNSFYGPFIFDDLDSIKNNTYIRQFWPLSSVLFGPRYGPVARRPVVNLSFAINFALGGLDVRGYHVVNLGIHVVNALLVFGIVRRTLARSNVGAPYSREAPWLALAAAGLWEVHPLVTDSVTYLTQRNELLMGLFVLLTLYCAVRGFDAANGGPWYIAAIVSCALGMGCKEVTAAAPLLVLVYDRTFVAGEFRAALRQRRNLYAGLAACWLIVAALLIAKPPRRSVGFGFESLSALGYIRIQLVMLAHYLRLSFWPHPLLLDYGWIVPPGGLELLSGALVTFGLLGLAVWALWRRPRLGFLGAWFFLILAPTTSFVPIVTEVAAERRMYLPLVAVVVLAIVGGRALLARLRWGARVAGVLALGIAIALTAATVRRNDDYRTEVAMWSDVTTKSPGNVRAHINLGDALDRQGRVEEAIEHYFEAVRLNPDSTMAQNRLALDLFAQGRVDEAIVHYHEVLRLDPSHAKARYNLGIALAKQGKSQEAIAQYREAVRIDPRYARAQHALGAALAAQGEFREARRHLGLALAADPSLAAARKALESLPSTATESESHP